jgi:hypothetical protein
LLTVGSSSAVQWEAPVDAFRELIYPALLTWSGMIKARAKVDPSSITPRELLSTLMEVWDDEDEEPEQD